MKYKFQDGIVYLTVAGVHLLVATRKAWDHFSPVKEVFALQAAFCEGISRGMNEDEIVQAVNMHGSSKDKLRERLSVFIKNMLEQGYIIPEDE